VELSPDKAVGVLKKLIKAERPNAFENIDASDLVLWHVTIPVDDDAEDEIITATSITTKRLLKGTGKISKTFGIEVPEGSSSRRLFKGKGTSSRTFKDGI